MLPQSDKAEGMLFRQYHSIRPLTSIAVASSSPIVIAMFSKGALRETIHCSTQIVAYIDTLQGFVPSGSLGMLSAPSGKRPAQSDQLSSSSSSQMSFLCNVFPEIETEKWDL